MTARFSSRDWRNEDGVWTWARLQQEWAKEPRIFIHERQPETARPFQALYGEPNAI